MAKYVNYTLHPKHEELCRIRHKKAIFGSDLFSSLLDIDSEQDVKQLMKHFGECKDILDDILDDYMHIVISHSRNVDLLTMSYFAHLEGLRCDHITICGSCKRHWGKERDKPTPVYIDDELNYFIGLMDQIHCYILHLHNVGLRTDEKTQNISAEIHEHRESMKQLFGSDLHRFGQDRFSVRLRKEEDVKGMIVRYIQGQCYFNKHVTFLSFA